jgi:hypothetical protein
LQVLRILLKDPEISSARMEGDEDEAVSHRHLNLYTSK